MTTTDDTAKSGATRATAIFVNLPVADLPKSIAFFDALGFTFDAQFTDATATCMVLGPNLYAMLLTHAKFSQFTPSPIADAHATSEVLVCLSLDVRTAVDDLVRRAVAAGGTTFRPAEDHGFMYAHAFRDLDGHIWELVHMDMAAFAKMRQDGAP